MYHVVYASDDMSLHHMSFNHLDSILKLFGITQEDAGKLSLMNPGKAQNWAFVYLASGQKILVICD